MADNSQPFILDMIETAKVGAAPGEAFAGQGVVNFGFALEQIIRF